MVFHRSLLRKPENLKADIFWGCLKISSFLQNAIGSYISLELLKIGIAHLDKLNKICALQYKSVNILSALHICIIWIVFIVAG